MLSQRMGGCRDAAPGHRGGCVGKADMSDTGVQWGGCPRTPMTHKVLETALPLMRETDVS